MKNLKMKSARAAKDLSQQQLADIVGVSRQTIKPLMNFSGRKHKNIL